MQGLGVWIYSHLRGLIPELMRVKTPNLGLLKIFNEVSK